MTQATISKETESTKTLIQTKSFTPSDIDRIFSAQKKKTQELKLTNYKQRILKLKKLKSVIFKYQPEVQKALYSDFKKSASEVDITEVLPVIGEINDAIRHLKHWMRPVNVYTPPTLLGSTSKMIYEPKGVCLIIAPWNYPFHLAMAPIAAAIAAGNTVMLKPSEFTPHTAHVLKTMLTEIFTEDEVAVFEGEVNVATALLENHLTISFLLDPLRLENCDGCCGKTPYDGYVRVGRKVSKCCCRGCGYQTYCRKDYVG